MTLVFAYGSLVSRESAEATLGRLAGFEAPVRLAGWRRRWTTVRDNLTCEKTFAPPGGGPFPYCLSLNIEPEPGAGGPNGALLRLSAAQLARLDVREMRYRRVDVTGMLTGARRASGPVIAYVARPEHHSPAPPAGAVILATYVRAVEAAFAALGADQLEAFRATTDPPPVEVADGALVADRIPPGNPRAW